jgi:hypothetical protein
MKQRYTIKDSFRTIQAGCTGCLLLVTIPALIFAACSAIFSSKTSKPRTITSSAMNQPLTPDFILQNCKRPDIDDNTLNENPRPTMVTRWMEWRAEGFKLVFLDAGNVSHLNGSWKPIGAIDLKSNQGLSADEVRRRLRLICNA